MHSTQITTYQEGGTPNMQHGSSLLDTQKMPVMFLVQHYSDAVVDVCTIKVMTPPTPVWYITIPNYSIIDIMYK